MFFSFHSSEHGSFGTQRVLHLLGDFAALQPDHLLRVRARLDDGVQRDGLPRRRTVSDIAQVCKKAPLISYWFLIHFLRVPTTCGWFKIFLVIECVTEFEK